jgi:hypothetical protein
VGEGYPRFHGGSAAAGVARVVVLARGREVGTEDGATTRPAPRPRPSSIHTHDERRCVAVCSVRTDVRVPGGGFAFDEWRRRPIKVDIFLHGSLWGSQAGAADPVLAKKQVAGARPASDDVRPRESEVPTAALLTWLRSLVRPHGLLVRRSVFRVIVLVRR